MLVKYQTSENWYCTLSRYPFPPLPPLTLHFQPLFHFIAFLFPRSVRFCHADSLVRGRLKVYASHTMFLLSLSSPCSVGEGRRYRPVWKNHDSGLMEARACSNLTCWRLRWRKGMRKWAHVMTCGQVISQLRRCKTWAAKNSLVRLILSRREHFYRETNLRCYPSDDRRWRNEIERFTFFLLLLFVWKSSTSTLWKLLQ